MIETGAVNGGTEIITWNSPRHQAAGGEKVLRWREDERMAGRVPVWERRDAQNTSAREQIADNLAQAANSAGTSSFENALAYAAQTQGPAEEPAQEFAFGDLVDMVNPLQHLPIVGHVYREVTGDEIRPIGRIVGGALYGGFAGAAAGLVDTVVEYETGKTLTGNVVAFVTEGDKPQYRSAAIDTPENRLNQAVETLDEPTAADLPGTVIGFADLGHGRREVYERIAPPDDERMAGTMVRRRAEIAIPHPAREPITRVALAPMPPAGRYSFND